MKALRISRVSILGVLFVCACGKGDAGKPTSEVDVHMPEKAIGANGGTESAPLSPEATAVRATRENPFRAISDDALDRDIRTAVAEAKASGKRVLLDFVAEWCTDCREVLRVAELEPARTLLRDKYIVVPMNVGKWDRAVRWRDAYGVKRIATLVVLDGEGNR
ncbi:MAG: thioredoxin family protein, partial [Myxococcales bacterium]|nr:thioredoxin family protein [Myxococcales bacterium]